MSDFVKYFEAYGANYTVTMNRFLNNEAVYLNILGLLFADNNLKELSGALKNNDIKSAFEAAHTLKGVVGNLGLTSFYNALSVIVERLRKKEPIDESYTEQYANIESEYEHAQEFYESLKAVS